METVNTSVEKLDGSDEDYDPFFVVSSPLANPFAEHDLIYLASPYSHEDIEVQEQRVQDILKITKYLIYEYGCTIFSPIVYTTAIHQNFEPLKGWYTFDLEFLKKCDAMVIVALDGFKQSRGIGLEIAFATGAKIPIYYMDPKEIKKALDEVIEI